MREVDEIEYEKLRKVGHRLEKILKDEKLTITQSIDVISVILTCYLGEVDRNVAKHTIKEIEEDLIELKRIKKG